MAKVPDEDVFSAQILVVEVEEAMANIRERVADLAMVVHEGDPFRAQFGVDQVEKALRELMMAMTRKRR